MPWVFSCDRMCSPSCAPPRRGTGDLSARCPSIPLSLPTSRTCRLERSWPAYRVNDQFLFRPLSAEDPQCPENALGYRVAAGSQPPRGNADAGSVEVSVGGGAQTLVVGPIEAPTCVREARLAFVVDSLGTGGTGTYRVWFSLNSAADAGPQPGDFEVTRGAVSVFMSTFPFEYLVASEVEWPFPTLFVKARLTPLAASFYNVNLTVNSGGLACRLSGGGGGSCGCNGTGGRPAGAGGGVTAGGRGNGGSPVGGRIENWYCIDGVCSVFYDGNSPALGSGIVTRGPYPSFDACSRLGECASFTPGGGLGSR